MSEKDAPKKQKGSFWYAVARVFAFIVMNTICPVHYHHKERIAGDAPYIIIANHRAWLDPVIMAKPIKHYDVRFLGKKELVKNPVANAILRNMHCIPVDRHGTDMVAMRACLSALRNGEVLGVFPEGTRHHSGMMDEMEGGIALIALRAGVPLIPMYITPKIRCFHRTDCYIGEPIPLDDLREQGVNKDTCQQLLDRITGIYRQMDAESKQRSC